MRIHSFTAAVLVGALLVAGLAVVAPAAAQENGTAANGTEAPPAEETERIDSSTVLVDAEYDDDAGAMFLTVRSERLQPITVTDAGGVWAGGAVEQRQWTLGSGETARLRMPVTKRSGRVAVTVTTRETLYGVPLRVDQPLIGGSATWGLAQLAGAGAATGVLLSVVGIAYWRKDGGREDIWRET